MRRSKNQILNTNILKQIREGVKDEGFFFEEKRKRKKWERRENEGLRDDPCNLF